MLVVVTHGDTRTGMVSARPSHCVDARVVVRMVHVHSIVVVVHLHRSLPGCRITRCRPARRPLCCSCSSILMEWFWHLGTSSLAAGRQIAEVELRRVRL